MERKKIAVVRIRGANKLRSDVEETMRMMRLHNKNSCVVIDNTESYVGMIIKAKDYITWGEIDEATFRILLEKRGKIVGNKALSEEYLNGKTKLDYDGFTKEFFAFKKSLKDVAGMKLFFRLKPPIGGFERQGIKRPYSMGGAIGYRKEKINELIRKML